MRRQATSIQRLKPPSPRPNLAGRKTLIIVAHRIATVRNCDLICYLENGRIVAQGRFEDLEINSEGFRRLTGFPVKK